MVAAGAGKPAAPAASAHSRIPDTPAAGVELPAARAGAHRPVEGAVAGGRQPVVEGVEERLARRRRRGRRCRRDP